MIWVILNFFAIIEPSRICERSLMQKRTVTVKKMSLHDDAHHSFVFGLTGDELLKMMTSMSAQRYFEIHGTYPPRLDKNKITINPDRSV